MPTEKQSSKVREARQLEPGDHPILSPDITLIPGAHIFIAANDKGGIGKSCAAIELYLACLTTDLHTTSVTRVRSSKTRPQHLRVTTRPQA